MSTPLLATLVGAVLVLVLLARLRAMRRGAKEGTEVLAMAVWSAFAPYSDAEGAEFGFRTACDAVFGKEAVPEHADWMDAHIRNFREWGRDGETDVARSTDNYKQLFHSYQRGSAFEAACLKVRELSLAGLEKATDDFLENDFLSPRSREALRHTVEDVRGKVAQEKARTDPPEPE